MEISIIADNETFEGVNEFIHFLYAIREAKKGDQELIGLFSTLQLNLNLHPLALFGLLMSRKPLSVDQALALKKILEIGGK
jgi:hypothetical protein